MKKRSAILMSVFLASGLVAGHAQLGVPGGGAMDAVMARVFGTNLNFSATVQVDQKMMPQNQTVSMPGKIYFAGGNSRSEMDMAQMTGGQMTPEMISQMKAMGMDKIISISPADKKAIFLVYPSLKAYVRIAVPAADSLGTNGFKVERTDLGKETVDGHSCLKTKYVVSNAKTGQQVTMTAWNAKDLNNCPVKIEQTAWASSDSLDGSTTTMHFIDINLAKPDGNLFTPPAGFKAYANTETMMQAEMMKQMGGGTGTPTGASQTGREAQTP